MLVVTRAQEALQLAAELLADMELSRLQPQQVVLKASRLARLVDDDDARRWIEWELNGYPNTADAFEHMRHVGRVQADDKGYFVPLSLLTGLASAQEQRLAASTGTSVAGEHVTTALSRHNQALGMAAADLGKLRGIEGAVVAAVYSFTSRTYYELLFSDLQADLFAAAQAEIDARLAPLTGKALDKIESISERLKTGDPEAVSQAMTTCRRLIDAAADALFPTRKEPYLLGEQALSVGPSNVLNRLQAYVADAGVTGGRRDRLRRTLNDLYNRASTGTHAEVDVVEARYVFLQTYVVLGELLSLEPA